MSVKTLIKKKFPLWLFNIIFFSLSIGIVLYLLVLIFSQFIFFKPDVFIKTLMSDELMFAIKLSLITATITSVIALVVGLPTGYILSRTDFPGKNIVDAILDIPIILSPIAVGTLLLIFLSTPMGKFIDNNIVSFLFNIPGIILAQFTIVSVLAIRLLKSTFDN